MSHSDKSVHPFFKPRRPVKPISQEPSKRTKQSTLPYAKIPKQVNQEEILIQQPTPHQDIDQQQQDNDQQLNDPQQSTNQQEQQETNITELQTIIPQPGLIGPSEPSHKHKKSSKPFVFTKQPPTTYPKLLSEEPLKAESSTAILREFVPSLPTEKTEFNFYGRIKKPACQKEQYDHEFSRLDRSIYKQGHFPIRRMCSQVPLTPLYRTENANHIQHIVHQHHPWLDFNRLPSVTHRMPKRTDKKKKIQGEKAVKEWLDGQFPDWHTFPSCVRLLRRIMGPQPKDENRQSWIEKYRPRTVDGLLGPKHNHVYLKNWLHQMKIKPTAAPCEKEESKKKNTSLDFMEEENEESAFDRLMSKRAKRVEDDDDDFMISPAAARKKAIKQQQEEEEKGVRSNVVLIVGDYGVGKTALVYTAAEQEGYEVFEVNAGSKRSGKDIVSALGEMTKSHLVTFHNKLEIKKTMEEDENNKKKKKRKLNPFLSSKGMNHTIPQEKKTNGGLLLSHFVRKKQPTTTATEQQQGPKQSLILLEEVDLLFEEDKGFWTSVIELSQNSKRPIIMTCNGKKTYIHARRALIW